jgi:hypothetical protein
LGDERPGGRTPWPGGRPQLFGRLKTMLETGDWLS